MIDITHTVVSDFNNIFYYTFIGDFQFKINNQKSLDKYKLVNNYYIIRI